MNQRLRGSSTSQYKGVRLNKAIRPYGVYFYWSSRIRLDDKLIHIGMYKTELSAALAYNQKAKELFGEFANLNNVGAL